MICLLILSVLLLSLLFIDISVMGQLIWASLLRETSATTTAFGTQIVNSDLSVGGYIEKGLRHLQTSQGQFCATELIHFWKLIVANFIVSLQSARHWVKPWTFLTESSKSWKWVSLAVVSRWECRLRRVGQLIWDHRFAKHWWSPGSHPPHSFGGGQHEVVSLPRSLAWG